MAINATYAQHSNDINLTASAHQFSNLIRSLKERHKDERSEGSG